MGHVKLSELLFQLDSRSVGRLQGTKYLKMYFPLYRFLGEVFVLVSCGAVCQYTSAVVSNDSKQNKIRQASSDRSSKRSSCWNRPLFVKSEHKPLGQASKFWGRNQLSIIGDEK